MSRLRQYLDTDWFIILYIVSLFGCNAILFNIFPGLNDLPTWALYITLIITSVLTCIFGMLLILYIDIKIDERRTLKNEYKKK